MDQQWKLFPPVNPITGGILIEYIYEVSLLIVKNTLSDNVTCQKLLIIK
jgi:hypothetical protein